MTRVEVLRGGAGDSPLAGYEGAELTGRLARPGAPAGLPDKRVIEGGMRAVVFLDITADTRPPWAVGFVRGAITPSSSKTEPGQPCVMTSGVAFGCLERTCMK